MPSHHSIFSHPGVIYVQLSGVISDTEILKVGNRVLEDPAYSKDYLAIWDFSQVEVMDIPMGGISNIVEFERRNRGVLGTEKRALVFKGMKHMVLFRLFSALRTGQRESRSFFTLSSACNWLQIDEAMIRQNSEN